MKTIIRLAKLELNTLFYSPVAWVLSVVFLFQCGMAFTANLDGFLVNQGLGGEYLRSLNFLTSKIYAGTNGMFLSILGKLYLYLPLLTMGLISREVSSGTIKLLYSSPVKIRQIILGKFFAMMAYNLLLVFILGMFACTGFFVIKAADGGLLFSCLLGIFLLLCAYSAIGLFMSCLTSYQIVAAVSTLVVFALLYYIGQVWQDVDFVRDLTYFLSLSGRTSNMLEGLISTKDILYFVIIIAMFLSFAIIRLQSGRSSRSALNTAGRYLAVLAIALAAGYITSLPALIRYYDATADKVKTLTPATQKVLKEIGDEPLEITSYINLLDQRYVNGQPSQRNVDLNYWSLYLRFKPNIKFNYVYYYDTAINEYTNYAKDHPGKSIKQIAELYAKSYKTKIDNFLPPAGIKKIINLVPEKNRYVMQVKFKGKTTFLRLFDDPRIFPGEAEITAALKRLTVAVPKVAFLAGELERSRDKVGPKDYGPFATNIVFRHSLINKGFDSETITLEDQEIPSGLAALVIADPRTNFEPEVLSKVKKYIADGGNLLIAGEPGKQDIINPILQPLGVQMMDGMLLQKDSRFSREMVSPFLTAAAAGFSKDLEKSRNDSIAISMPGVAGLSYSANGPYTVTPLLMTDEKISWNKKGVVVLDSAAIEFSPEEGDDKTSVATVLALTRKINGKEQRIIVSGDADFLTTAALARYKNSNFVFNSQVFRWFTYGQFPIDDSRPAAKDNRLTLTNGGLTILKLFYLGILPGLLVVFAAIFLIRRKRK